MLSEMRRVLRPGGLLLVAEPNNLASMLVADSTTGDRPTDELTERVAFALRCERGKAALDEGDNSVGDQLPGYFAHAGLINIQTFLNDKAFALVPPYVSPEQQALRTATLQDAAQNRWIGWTASGAKRYYLAGGGREDEFERGWQRRLEEGREVARQLTANKLHTAGGGIQYVVLRPTIDLAVLEHQLDTSEDPQLAQRNPLRTSTRALQALDLARCREEIGCAVASQNCCKYPPGAVRATA